MTPGAMHAQTRDGRTLRAARWALENGRSLSDAAREFGCRVGSVAETWRRMYPDVPALVNRRRGAMIQAWPEDEVSW